MDKVIDFKDKVVIEGAFCHKATPKAILVHIPDRDDSIWFPLSQVDDDSEVWNATVNNSGKLIISEWIAREKGLI